MVRRVPRARTSLLALGAGGLAIVLATSPVGAELENQVFSSTEHGLRLVVPRGWRATEQASYPGLLLWMLRSQPEGKIVLTSEPFTRAVYCSWPLECRTSADPLPSKLACALRSKLIGQRLRVGPIQAGPKENEKSGIPSVWFELDDGKRFLRQAVSLDEDHVISLVLTAGSAEARAAHVRAFEQALRTLRPLNDEERGTARAGAATQTAADAGVPADAAATAGATTFASTPDSKLEPVGPCARP